MPDPVLPNASPSKFVGILESLNTWAAGRNYISFVIGILGAMSAIGFLDQDQQKVVLDSINQIMEGLGKISSGLLALWPIAILVIGRVSGVAASIFGRAKAVNDDAAKNGLKLIVAEDSKLAPLINALPGDNSITVPPAVPVEVTVPAPVEPVKTVTLPSFFAIALLVMLLPALGGCSTFADFMRQAMAVISKVGPVLAEVREGIRVSCNAIGYAEQEAATKSPNCASKVKKTVAAWSAVCTQQSLLTDDVIGNYFSSIATAVKDVDKACK